MTGCGKNQGRGIGGESGESLDEGEGNDGLAAEASALFGFSGESGFQLVGFEMNGAGGNFLVAGSVKAKVANAKAVFRGQRWSEGAAGERTRGIKVAQPGGGIESGTGLLVGEVFEGIGTSGIDDAAVRIAGKSGRETGDGLPGTSANGGSSLRICGVESGEACAEPARIKLRNGKDADAALGTAWAAFEVSSGTARSVGDGGIDDLNQFEIARGEHAFRLAEWCGNEEVVMLSRYSAFAIHENVETCFLTARMRLAGGVSAWLDREIFDNATMNVHRAPMNA